MLKWGILSTGHIAAVFAQGLKSSETGVAVAVGSRTREAADAFGDKFQIPRRHGSYDALLADPEVEAVYIATPHPQHAEWAIKAAEAGKHILCEKPLTVNHAEALEVIEAARRHGVFLMEAFMYRCHPQTARVIEMIRDNVIGRVGFIEASFGFRCEYNLEHRALNHDLAGGGILDVGCYPVSMTRLIAGVARGKEFADPESLSAHGVIGPESRVDEIAVATLRFPGDVLANIATAVQLRMENVVRIHGTEGSLLVPIPWGPGIDGSSTKILLKRHDQEQPVEHTVKPYAGLFTIEADTVAAHIQAHQAPSPAMTWDDTLGNMKTLDRWRQAIGLRYDFESMPKT